VRLFVAGLRARISFLAFPAGMAWQARLLRHTPLSISDWLTRQWARKMKKK
jgi:hypothetical protein